MTQSGEQRYQVRLTDEQWRKLWAEYPDDPELRAFAAQRALSYVHVPNKTGRTKNGNRVYYDDGFMGSGYLMIHWEDAKELGWCQDNGYFYNYQGPTGENGLPSFEEPITWDENPERERLEDVRNKLWELIRA